MKSGPMFDCRKIVAYFGGALSLADKAATSGFILNLKTIYKWHERNSLSSGMIAILTKVAKDNGMPFDLSNFLLEE